MENEIVFSNVLVVLVDQAVQPNIYLIMIFIMKDFVPNFENLLRLPNYFANYLKTNWNWLFKFPHNYGVDMNLTFNMNIYKFIYCYIKFIVM
jgi:hypothetical protein